jgi:hypothetical protein
MLFLFCKILVGSFFWNYSRFFTNVDKKDSNYSFASPHMKKTHIRLLTMLLSTFINFRISLIHGSHASVCGVCLGVVPPNWYLQIMLRKTWLLSMDFRVTPGDIIGLEISWALGKLVKWSPNMVVSAHVSPIAARTK